MLDLNELCRGVVKLVSSDAVIRNITVTLDVDPEPTIVYGDHVQLQQVVLNLLLNAMEAIAEGSGGDRLIVVRTRTSRRRPFMCQYRIRGRGSKTAPRSWSSSRFIRGSRLAWVWDSPSSA